jgi:signal transduction histidine kinase
LIQVISNLALNAFEAMEIDGTLMISTYESEGFVVIAFQDEGCGIPLNLLSKVQERFVTTKEKGSGMGLPICYELVHQHGGNIQVQTGQTGTCFEVYLPSADGQIGG